MKNGRRQAAFTLVEGLLAIAAFALLGLSSWVVYQHVKSSATTTGATANPSQSSQQTIPTSPAPTVTYLTITEWGIKLPLSDRIKDAYYVVGEDKTDGVPTTMWVSLKSLTDPSCNPANNDRGGQGAIGAIDRFSPTGVDGVTGEPLTQKYPNGTTIGSYYYAFVNWGVPASCASPTTVQSIDGAFASAAKGNVMAATN